MTKTNKEELISTLTKLIATLAEDEPPKTDIPAPPEAVEMLTVKECCEEIKGLNDYTVRQLVTRGEIPFVRAGCGKNGKILIPKAALITYLNGCAKGGV